MHGYLSSGTTIPASLKATFLTNPSFPSLAITKVSYKWSGAKTRSDIQLVLGKNRSRYKHSLD